MNSSGALYVGHPSYDGPTMEKTARNSGKLRAVHHQPEQARNTLDRTVERTARDRWAKLPITFCHGPIQPYLNGIPTDQPAVMIRDSSTFALDRKLHKQVVDLIWPTERPGLQQWAGGGTATTGDLHADRASSRSRFSTSAPLKNPLQRRGAQADALISLGDHFGSPR